MGVAVIGVVSCASGDGTFGWSNAAALRLMEKNGALLRFELCTVFGQVQMLSLNTCGVATNGSMTATLRGWEPMVEQLGTNGSKHAGLGTNSETHGVPGGIFGKPGYRNTFFFLFLFFVKDHPALCWHKSRRR